jgi:hypothetical protein
VAFPIAQSGRPWLSLLFEFLIDGSKVSTCGLLTDQQIGKVDNVAGQPGIFSGEQANSMRKF